MNVISRYVKLLKWNRIFLLTTFFVTIIPMSTIYLSSLKRINVGELLNKTLKELDIITKQNLELQEILTSLKAEQNLTLEHCNLIKAEEEFISNDSVGCVARKEDPNTQYEILRRRISSNILELSFFINSEIRKLQKQVSIVAPKLLPSLKHVLDLGGQHTRWLLSDMEKLAEADGYATWRKKEANKLGNLVQTRLRYLQNRPDCKKAKKLQCSLRMFCGFGCLLHHIVYCFIVAYATQRTLLLQYEDWSYQTEGWEDVFKPISDTCIEAEEGRPSEWPGNVHTELLTVPAIGLISPRPSYLPLAIPEDLSHQLISLHGNPTVWCVGQFFKYILRPQRRTAIFLKNATAKIGFKKPIVGVHVRRSDKIIFNEASYHAIEEYMSIVDEYYDQLELKQKVDKRRIYIATDDPAVITEVRNKYPHYEILGDPAVSKTAAISTRYSAASLQGIILDVHMLSMTDFLVCTFSSQLCKLAFGLMQNHFPDASAKFRSLDDIYYFPGQSPHIQIVIIAHDRNRSDEIQLMKGDFVHILGNHWDGYSKGRNLRTNQTGLFPSFKVEDKVEIAKFPTYSEMYNNQTEEENGYFFLFLIDDVIHIVPIFQFFFLLCFLSIYLCFCCSKENMLKLMVNFQ